MRRANRSSAGLVVALIALVGIAHSAGDQGLVLRYRLAKGDKVTYNYSGSARAQLDVQKGLTTAKAEVSLQMKVVAEVLDTKPNGDLQVQAQIVSGTVKMKSQGQQQSTPVQPAVANYEVTSRGEIKTAELLSGEPAAIGTIGLAFMPDDAFLLGGVGIFPERALKVGDKWKGVTRLTNPVTGETEPFSYESKLLAQEQVKGRPCVKVRTTATRKLSQTIDAPDGSRQARVSIITTDEITWRFDYQRGVIMLAEDTDRAAMAMEGTGAEGGPASAKMAGVLNSRSVLTEFNGKSTGPS